MKEKENKREITEIEAEIMIDELLREAKRYSRIYFVKKLISIFKRIPEVLKYLKRIDRARSVVFSRNREYIRESLNELALNLSILTEERYIDIVGVEKYLDTRGDVADFLFFGKLQLDPSKENYYLLDCLFNYSYTNNKLGKIDMLKEDPDGLKDYSYMIISSIASLKMFNCIMESGELKK
ncbi:MAG: hypothetical protein WC306_01680 [Candidatus Paceibacterota bacterium]|jgi:hypothetical protein